ncbi:MAG: hypothetical protein L6R42_009748, partial [Xanthoria sp. 1 TBL-2021]
YLDLARLLNIYQLWLDDLYPRAKFADGLAMIEKLGHKKRIQIMRREWIHEGKPREKYNEMDATKEAEGTVQPESDPKHRDATGDNTKVVETFERHQMSDPSNEDLFRGVPHRNAKLANDETETLFLPNDATDDQPPEDDLDALLAETADDNEGRSFVIPSPPRRQESHTGEDDFDDEEALAAMGLFRTQMELLDAIGELQLKATSLESQTDELLCRLKEKPQPKIHSAPSRETLKQDLEAAFLQPPTAFDNEWLNRLQQRWAISTDLTALFELAPTQTRSRIRFIREGLEGKVIGYKEVTVPATSATAKNSTSFLRRPANRADFVRGAAGFLPFAPGGLDDIQAVADSEDRHSREILDVEKIRPSALDRVIEVGPEKRLLEVPPGFTRGLRFDRAKITVDKTTASQIEESLSQQPTDHEGRQNEPVINLDVHSMSDEELDEADAERDAIDDLLPVEFAALQPHGILAASTTKRGGREWAHMVDVKREITNFGELVPEMARTWPFELDTFQKEAVYHLESGDS